MPILSYMNRIVEPYTRLAAVYDAAWSDFCASYIGVIEEYIDPANSRVLDLACGTGELLRLFAAYPGASLPAGAPPPAAVPRLAGVDLSPRMVAIARRKLPGILIIAGDVREVRLNRRFDLVTCTHDALNYLADTDDLARLVKTARLHLRPGGLFAFDFNTPAAYAAFHNRPRTTLTVAGAVTQTTTYEATTRTATTRFSFADGSVEEHRQHAFTQDEVFSALEDFGFGDLDEYDVDEFAAPDDGGDTDRNPEGKPGTVVWVARVDESEAGRYV